MCNWKVLILLSWVLPPISASFSDVTIWNHFQTVEVEVIGDGEVLDVYQENNNGGGDAELFAETYYCGYAFGESHLKTTYSSERITTDGRVSVSVFPAWDIDELSTRARVYYQTVISVSDEPVWLKISGYLTSAMGHAPNDHFFVGLPSWYWWTNDGSGDKEWMFDTMRFEPGEYVMYGGVDYTVSVESEGDTDSLDADYFFSIEVLDAPPFEFSDADLNRDGKVNLDDLSLFAAAWLWEETRIDYTAAD